MAAERQIASTPGFPDIGRDRQIAVRVTNGFASRVVNLLASCIVMPDGDKAVLLAAPAGEAAGAPARAERAIGGFGEEGRYIALLDGEGKVLAASPEFGSLAIGEDNLLGLISEARGPERLAKKRIPVRGLRMPAGLARLIDEPATHLIVVVDDGEAAESAEFAAATSAPEPVSPALQDASATAKGDDSAADLNAPSDIEATIAASAGGERSHGSVDRWYFHHEEGARSAANTPPPHGQDNEPPAISAPPAPAPRQLEFSTAPVKFVWRTGSDGRFTSISEEFSAALGEASADVVGRSFREVAEAFGFDADGEIAALLARRDTWSGRSVLWPIAGTDRRVPVDLAALPVYG
ncbi:MAG: PAS domain-containing sensor histidine kinase, partial [Rhizobiaceae bacterium]